MVVFFKKNSLNVQRCRPQAPEKNNGGEDNGAGTGAAPPGVYRQRNGGGALLSEGLLHQVKSDLQLHLSLSALFTLAIMLSAPSLLHWARNLRY